MRWQLANGWESANPALNSSPRLFNGKVVSGPELEKEQRGSLPGRPGTLGQAAEERLVFFPLQYKSSVPAANEQ